MRTISKLVGLSAVAVALAWSNAAHAVDAQSNLVDGSATVGSTVCSWTNGSTDANPPNTLTIDRASVNQTLTCSDGATGTLDNSPTVSFDDANGTATVDAVQVTGTQSGVSCSYRASDVTLQRDGTTRNYAGSFTASKVGGSWLCPGSASGEASLSFH